MDLFKINGLIKNNKDDFLLISDNSIFTINLLIKM